MLNSNPKSCSSVCLVRKDERSRWTCKSIHHDSLDNNDLDEGESSFSLIASLIQWNARISGPNELYYRVSGLDFINFFNSRWEKRQQQLSGVKHCLNDIWICLACIEYRSSACQVVNAINRSPPSLMLIIVCGFKALCYVVLSLFTATDQTPIKPSSPVRLSEACLDQSKCLLVYTEAVWEAKVSISCCESYF